MKICPACNQTYTDEVLNFCLTDGSLLNEAGDDAPPTLLMNQARTTQPNWNEYQTPPAWGNQPLQTNQPSNLNQPFYPALQGQNQTLPTVSLILGILSLVFFCCYGGFPFGIAAMITGYIGLQNANKDPMLNGGRNLAIAGMILGGIGFVGVLILVIIGILANIG